MATATNKGSAKKTPSDLLAFDLGAWATKVIRLKRVGENTTVTGVAVLPAATSGQEAPAPSMLSKAMLANYAALAFSGERAIVRVVSLPGHVEEGPELERRIRDHLSLDAQYRVSFIPSAGGKKTETRLLTVAVPEADVQAVLGAYAVGAPAPYSLEISGLAALNACLAGPASQHPQEPLCLMDCGARCSVMAIANKGVLVLARKLDVGGDSIVQHVQKQLGVDEQTARSILSEGAIDISQSVREVMDPFLRQLTISRDFVEREENCRVSVAYLSGGMSLSSYWVGEIRKATNMDVRAWNPFDGLILAPGALPPELEGQQCRFAAAVGAALGVLRSS